MPLLASLLRVVLKSSRFESLTSSFGGSNEALVFVKRALTWPSCYGSSLLLFPMVEASKPVMGRIQYT